MGEITRLLPKGMACFVCQKQAQVNEYLSYGNSHWLDWIQENELDLIQKTKLKSIDHYSLLSASMSLGIAKV